MATCPPSSVSYNKTLCACPAGYFLNRTANPDQCSLFRANTTIVTGTGVEPSSGVSFAETFFSLDSFKKLTQSQGVFLEATLVLVVSWLLFCLFLRFTKLGNGRNFWFQIRWWISCLDTCFSTRHWLDDQKVVVKRKTELGGALSMASWILFTGLFAALLYQAITKRSIEVHNVRATNAPDLASFINDMEFNITAISSMSCSNLRGLGTLVTGNLGYFDQRVTTLKDFVNYTCLNSSMGPTINLKCSKCQIIEDYMYISWQFVDLPSIPATAAGFQFNFTARNHADTRHASFVSGTITNADIFNDRPVTFRGKDENILNFNLFPRRYISLHDLRLIQPLFHEFRPGSFFHETSQLQASLETPGDGLINTTLYINYLSAYLVEIENQSILDPVSFLADLGGLYCISIGIFFYCLVQCEYRVKRLRNEDSTMQQIRSQLRARKHWDKLRKYVMYTWGCPTLGDNYSGTKKESGCSHFLVPSMQEHSRHGSRSSSKRGLENRTSATSISLKRRVSVPSEKPLEGEMLASRNDAEQHTVDFYEGNSSVSRAYSHVDDNAIPLPAPPEFKAGSEIEVSEIQKNLQQLYDYNVMLRERLLATQSLVHTLASKSSTPSTESQT